MCCVCRPAAATSAAPCARRPQHTYVIPGTRRTRVAVETMRDWLKLYRTGGFEALYPKPRSDRGQPRRLPPEVAEVLVSLKTEQPTLSVKALIKCRPRALSRPPARALDRAPAALARGAARQAPRRPCRHRPATLRLPRRRGAVDERCDARAEGARRAPAPKDLSSSPSSTTPTRVIPFAAFAYSENTTAFLPVFKQAIARRGLPARLYCDNGASYRSHQLALVCAKLGIALIHARPYQPAGKGKNRTLLPYPSRRLARPPHPRSHRVPSDAQPHPVGLGRGRVPPLAPSRPRRADPARPVGARRRARALPRPRHRPRRPLPLRGQARV